MVREQDAVLLAGPLVDYLIAVARRAREQGLPVRRELALGAAGVAAFFLVYVLELPAYLVLNGRPGPSRLVMRKMTWTSPHALEVLLSSRTRVHRLDADGGALHRRPVPAASARYRARPTGYAVNQVRPVAAAMLVSLFGHIYISGCVDPGAFLRNLCVLCVSVVKMFPGSG